MFHKTIPAQTASLYIHVPFCATRCSYCDFYSTTFSEEVREAYVSALIAEMNGRRCELSALTTIYFGGGTPSQLPAAQIRRIFDTLYEACHIAEDAEITFECNPDDVTPQLAALLAEMGVNRVSLGIQTFDDGLLRFIRRRHTAGQARRAVELLAEKVTANISVDLIYGLPGQSLAGFQVDVEAALSLPISHISAYALSIEPGTQLHALLENGTISEAPEELSLQMYRHLLNATAAAGFEHYEISNFALPGRHSRHNSTYWSGKPYAGMGPGAHSFDGNATRRENTPDLKEYIRLSPLVPTRIEHLSRPQQYDELIMTRLRTRTGLPLSLLTADERRFLLREAQRHLKSGALRLEGDVLRLSRDGIFVSDGVMSDLMMVE